jgi:catechol 2,3-dioxygenase-like lactoylglutathione lyase family enzyme
MIDHVSIQCADAAASAAFYDAVLRPLGGERIMAFEGAIGYGVPPVPTFWMERCRIVEPSHLDRFSGRRHLAGAIH